MLAATAAGLSACAQHFRNPDEPLQHRPAVELVRVRWMKQLVPDELLYYQRQEWATAAIAPDGSLFVGSSAGAFFCFEVDGKRRWRAQLEGAISSEPLYDFTTDTVFVGADDGKMYALDTVTGKTRWRYVTQGVVVPRPIVSEGLVIFSTSEDRVYALNATDGSWKWQYGREKPDYFTIQGYSGVTVSEGLTFVGFSDGTLVALKSATGELIWERPLAGNKRRFVDVDGTPTVWGDTIYTSSYANGVFAVNKKTGSVQWHLPVEGASAIAATTAGLFFTAPKLGLVAITMRGKGRWRQAIAEGVPSRPIVVDDLVFLTGTRTGLFVASARSGTLYQYFDPGEGISAAPAVGSDSVAVLTNRGRFYTFDRFSGRDGHSEHAPATLLSRALAAQAARNARSSVPVF